MVRRSCFLSQPSEIETYLAENHGDLLNFKLHMIAGFSAGTAFLSALSTEDIYEIRNAGIYEILRTKSQIDGPHLLDAIVYLKGIKNV